MSRGILVDTSVWIDLLRGSRSRACRKLEQLLAEDEAVFVTGLVVTEILRGCRDDSDAERVRDALGGFPWVEPSYPATYERAAQLHRRARRKGMTVRSTIDCVLAATAIERGLAVLHRDRDFDALAMVSELAVVEM